jgi:dTDP-4-dehydrorhamnose 3,5-epimerase-like enzyme
VRFDDPRLSIRWPLAAVNVSARDQGLPLVPDGFRGIAL